MKEGKAWGRTTTVLETPFFSIHYLAIEKGGFCSEHKHAKKTNLFFVIGGKLEVTIWRGAREPDIVTLQSGEETVIEPGVWHKFRALENTVCLEIYEVALDQGDIERRTVGGLG